MKKLIILPLLLLLSYSSVAQEWAPVGATWYYTRYNPPIPPAEFTGHTKIESIGETEILGITCKVLEVTDENSVLQDTHYMYQNEFDQIFKYYENMGIESFCLVYDFSLMEDENYDLSCYSDLGAGEFTNYITMVIEEEVNGINLIKQSHFANEDNLVFGWDGDAFEFIGNIKSFLPWNHSEGVGELICYEDEYLGQFVLNEDLCDEITGIENHGEISTLIQIYPNPTTDKIIINSSLKIEKITISNVVGNEVLIFTASQNEINLSNLMFGIYFVNCHTDLGIVSKKIIVTN